MKKTIIAVFCFASFTATAQKMKAALVPASVKTSFTQRFPSVKHAKWEKEDGDYEAAFKQNGQELTASFDAAGAWKETEREIPVSELPAAAMKYLHMHYKGQKVKEAAELKMADGSTHYEAEVGKTDVIFDSNGEFLKTQKG